MRKRTLQAVILAIGALGCRAGEPLIRSGEGIAFLGDSITQLGASHPGGYVRLVVSGLAANGIQVNPVCAGISGHKSDNMLERVDRDVISKKPAVMTLSCGVNDVWHGVRGIPLEAFQKNITALIDKVQAAGVKPILLTATPISEDAGSANNKKLEDYNQFLRTFAAARKLPLADLNTQMWEAIRQAKAANAPKPNRANYMTSDGVHMAPEGDQVMAEGVLRALGLDATQIDKARAAWLEIPASTPLKSTTTISLKEYRLLAAAAAREGLSVSEYVDREVAKALAARIAN